MPIDVNGQGWNEVTTPLKQEWFSKFAYFHLDWTDKVIKRMKQQYCPENGSPSFYHYIDTTAGAGYSPAYGDGSPVIHAKAAEEYRRNHGDPLRIKAHLIEENPSTAFELKKTLVVERDLMLCPPLYDSFIHDGKYEKVLPRDFFHYQRRQNRLPFSGLLYCDPNGQIPEFELLKQLNHYHPRLDILLHVSATTIKRVRLAFNGLDLAGCMAHTGKRNWKLARLGRTAHQWTFLFGTNFLGLRDWRKIGLYAIDSPTGNDILRRLNYTAREYAELPKEGQLELWS